MDKAQRTAPLQCVLIAGPTASGKSAVALELAKTFDGVVINADSMQIYRELRIITNRPSPEEEAAAPHKLYGVRAMREAYSTALWLSDVARELAVARAGDKLPILVGGTGLYFTALTEGLSAVPAIPDEIRDHYRRIADEEPLEVLYAELYARDEVMATRLKPGDKQRITRSLEVLEATGRSLSEWQQSREPALVELEQAYPLVVTMERPELYVRCDARFDALMAAGALQEAERVAALGLPQDLPAMRAVGLRELLDYVAGRATLEEAVSEAKTATRRYAKRQITWTSNHFISWNTVFLEQIESIKHELSNVLK